MTLKLAEQLLGLRPRPHVNYHISRPGRRRSGVAGSTAVMERSVLSTGASEPAGVHNSPKGQVCVGQP